MAELNYKYVEFFFAVQIYDPNFRSLQWTIQ